MLLRTRTELYSGGAYVARAGERADRLIVVVAGRINISPPGKRYFMGRINAGCASHVHRLNSISLHVQADQHSLPVTKKGTVSLPKCWRKKEIKSSFNLEFRLRSGPDLALSLALPRSVMICSLSPIFGYNSGP